MTQKITKTAIKTVIEKAPTIILSIEFSGSMPDIQHTNSDLDRTRENIKN